MEKNIRFFYILKLKKNTTLNSRFIDCFEVVNQLRYVKRYKPQMKTVIVLDDYLMLTEKSISYSFY